MRKVNRKKIFLSLGALLVALPLGTYLLWVNSLNAATLANFDNRAARESTQIYDRSGKILLYDVHGTMERTFVPLDKISPYIIKGSIAIEDDGFYTHSGIEASSLLRAALADMLSGSPVEGGSTITQQVVKNALLTPDKTIGRKLKEMVLATQLEKVNTKDQILEKYFNETPYGGTLYGVETAAEHYFGVNGSEVTLAEAAYLAALPKAPTHYSPYGAHRDELNERKNLVLQKMLALHFITETEYAAAYGETVVFNEEEKNSIKAPHFVFYVLDYLEKKYGKDAVENGNMKIITTLDWGIQQKAESTLAAYAPRNQRDFNASNAGLVALDPKTGQILAMVGSRDYFSKDIDGMFNVTTARRQPGSSFKPFVYATAFEKGYTPETVVFNLKTQFSTSCSAYDLSTHDNCYSPDNYDGRFTGPITFRNALAQSVNVPAVKVLYLAGIEASIHTAQKMGITTLDTKNDYGLSLVLGGSEVELLDMTSAYGVFANDGVRNSATPILNIHDANGKELVSFKPSSVQVLKPEIAREISDILSDNDARAPEFGVNSPLNFNGFTVADKTGTTNDYRDAWIIGYTPSLVMGAWVGNNDNTPMEKRIAAFIVAPLWHEVMQYALEKYPEESFPQPPAEPPQGTVPPVLAGNWNTNPLFGVHEILFWIDKKNVFWAQPSNPYSDPEFHLWDYPVQVWAGQIEESASENTASSTSSILLTPEMQTSQATTSIPLPVH